MGAVLEVLRSEPAGRYLAEYFREDEQHGYTGRRFEVLDGGGDRPAVRDVINDSDLLSLALLSIDLRGRWLVRALDRRDAWSELLSQVPADLHLRDADDAVLKPGSALHRLWQEVAGVDGGNRWVTAGKLLARKRPHLVPVLDRVVLEVVRPPKDGWWRTMRRVLQVPGLEKRLGELRQEGSVPSHVSDLRLLDVVLWRTGKERDVPASSGEDLEMGGS